MAPSRQIARPDTKPNPARKRARLHAPKPRHYLDLGQGPCGAPDWSLNLGGL
jgi:hypothetical protein